MTNLWFSGIIRGRKFFAVFPAMKYGGHKKRGRLMAILLSGALLCGIGTGCTGSNTTESAKADYIWSNVAIGGGGYVTGMEYNPKEEGLVYARTDIGGLYRRKKDTDWVPLTDFLGSDDWGYIGIESVATDPVEPNRVYFAGGTYMNNPAALFASDDYGDTWDFKQTGAGGWLQRQRPWG